MLNDNVIKFKALADETERLKILYEISQNNRLCVSDLQEIFKMPQSKMSYHLKLLLSSKIITKHNQAQWSFYEVNHEEIKKLVSPAVYEMLIKRAVESK
jgi:ArsR family transcriptional regulator